MDLEQARKTMGKTQMEMADFLHISFSSYQRYKNHPEKIPESITELLQLKMTLEYGTLGNLLNAFEAHFRIEERFNLLVEQVDTLRLMVKERDKELLKLQKKKKTNSA